jgi:hypothetical protein
MADGSSESCALTALVDYVSRALTTVRNRVVVTDRFSSATAKIMGAPCSLAGFGHDGDNVSIDVDEGTLTLAPDAMTMRWSGSSPSGFVVIEFEGRRGPTDPPSP